MGIREPHGRRIKNPNLPLMKKQVRGGRMVLSRDATSTTGIIWFRPRYPIADDGGVRDTARQRLFQPGATKKEPDVLMRPAR